MSVCDFVTLRAGLVVPRAALETILDLEARGVHVNADGDELVVPRGVLTDDERKLLKRWKRHVLALLAYQAPETVQ